MKRNALSDSAVKRVWNQLKTSGPGQEHRRGCESYRVFEDGHGPPSESPRADAQAHRVSLEICNPEHVAEEMGNDRPQPCRATGSNLRSLLPSAPKSLAGFNSCVSG